MKKNKVKALLLSISMMAAMSTASVGGLTVNAAAVVGVSGEQADVTPSNTQTVTVSGLKEKSTVKLYQIVAGYYNSDKKLVKYVLMDPTNGKIAAIGDSDKGQTKDSNDIITENEITTIANNIQSGVFDADSRGIDGNGSHDMTVNGTSATASVEPGLYMVLATDPSGETVYNPAVVAVNITDANAGTESAGSVDMTKFFRTDDVNGTDAVNNVYLKSSDSKDGADKKMTGTQKAAVQAEGETATDGQAIWKDKDGKDITNSHGDTISIGDTVHFRIDGIKIPSYSADYKAPFYNITDKIDSTFDAIYLDKVTVYVGGEDDTHKVATTSDTAKTYSIERYENSGFKITFDPDYIKGLRGKTDAERAVIVTYDATLGQSAGVNFAENHNRAIIQYANDPKDETGDPTMTGNTVNKDTYDYTFAIGASLDGQSATGTKEHEIVPSFTKVGPNGSVTVDESTGKATVTSPLAGATFTLYSDEACTKPSAGVHGINASGTDVTDGTTVSDNNGNIKFTGLDEGTYYMKETVAPDKYALSDKTYKFVIAATLNTDGILQSYSIQTFYKDASTLQAEGSYAWINAGTATYTSSAITKADDGSVSNTITRTDNATAIIDSKLQSLPSTGGTGTLVLTLVAAGGMACFITLYFASRKKENK